MNDIKMLHLRSMLQVLVMLYVTMSSISGQGQEFPAAIGTL